MNYKAKTKLENNGRVQKVEITADGIPLVYSAVLQRWQSDAEFRAFFLSILVAAPYPSYRWETPPVTKDTRDRIFEFVILNSPYLSQRTDPRPFQKFLNASKDEEVLVFPNLGKDATLVVPTQKGDRDMYAHLASFTRHANQSQQHAFWQKVGETMQQNLSEKPIWLSTAGAGIAWLHVRLDSSPKYYGYDLYKKFPYFNE